jgi:hypothetical protein
MRCGLIVFLLLGLAACVGSPAERRIRTYFDLPAHTPEDTVALRAAILRRLALGTQARHIDVFLDARGVGRDGLSAYYPARTGDTAIVRVEFDPRGWTFVAASYGVRLIFDSTARLSDVRVTRWVTGP